jgi:hypothetical protein
VVRHLGVTLLAIDPRSSRAEVARWTPENMTIAERDVLRAAYGQPPVGEPLDAELVSDLPFPLVVPRAARLPGEPLARHLMAS